MAVPTVTPCGCCPSWVFLHEKAYQVRDTVIESSVVTKVKGIGRYAGRVLDTADYVTPHQVRGHRAPTLPRFSLSDGAEGWQGDGQGDGDIPPPPPPGHLGVRGGHQADPDGEPGTGRLPGGTDGAGGVAGRGARRGACPPATLPRLTNPPPQSEAEYRCTADRDCQRKGPTTGSGEGDPRPGGGGLGGAEACPLTTLMGAPAGLLTGRCVPYNGTLRTCEIQGWCPPEVDTIDV